MSRDCLLKEVRALPLKYWLSISFFLLICLISFGLTGCLTVLYWRSKKNPLVIICGLLILLEYLLIFSGLTLSLGILSNLNTIVCCIQGILLNYVFISINAFLAFILMENCLIIYKSHIGHSVKYASVSNYRMFFIVTALAVPLMPTAIVLFTHQVFDKSSIIQPRIYYCFFARCSLSGTSCWILFFALITILSGMIILSKIWRMRANLSRIMPISQPPNEMEDGKQWATVRWFNYFKRTLFNPQTEHLKSTYLLWHFVFIFLVYLVHTLLWIIPSMKHAEFVGKERMSPISSELLHPNSKLFREIIDKLMHTRCLYLKLPDDIIMNAGRDSCMAGLSRFLRIFEYKFTKPFSIDVIANGMNRQLVYCTTKSQSKSIERFIVSFLKDYRKLKISNKKSLATITNGKLNKPSSASCCSMEDFSFFLATTPIDMITFKITNNKQDSIKQESFIFPINRLINYFSIFLAYEITNNNWYLFMPASYGFLFFIMFGMTQKFRQMYKKILIGWWQRIKGSVKE